jgi:hypothetical protein
VLDGRCEVGILLGVEPRAHLDQEVDHVRDGQIEGGAWLAPGPDKRVEVELGGSECCVFGGASLDQLSGDEERNLHSRALQR